VHLQSKQGLQYQQMEAAGDFEVLHGLQQTLIDKHVNGWCIFSTPGLTFGLFMRQTE